MKLIDPRGKNVRETFLETILPSRENLSGQEEQLFWFLDQVIFANIFSFIFF